MDSLKSYPAPRQDQLSHSRGGRLGGGVSNPKRLLGTKENLNVLISFYENKKYKSSGKVWA